MIIVQQVRWVSETEIFRLSVAGLRDGSVLDPNVKPRDSRERHLSPSEGKRYPCVPGNIATFGVDITYAISLVRVSPVGLICSQVYFSQCFTPRSSAIGTAAPCHIVV